MRPVVRWLFPQRQRPSVVPCLLSMGGRMRCDYPRFSAGFFLFSSTSSCLVAGSCGSCCATFFSKVADSGCARECVRGATHASVFDPSETVSLCAKAFLSGAAGRWYFRSALQWLRAIRSGGQVRASAGRSATARSRRKEGQHAADPGRATGVDLGAQAGEAQMADRHVRATGRADELRIAVAVRLGDHAAAILHCRRGPAVDLSAGRIRAVASGSSLPRWRIKPGLRTTGQGKWTQAESLQLRPVLDAGKEYTSRLLYRGCITLSTGPPSPARRPLLPCPKSRRSSTRTLSRSLRRLTSNVSGSLNRCCVRARSAMLCSPSVSKTS